MTYFLTKFASQCKRDCFGFSMMKLNEVSRHLFYFATPNLFYSCGKCRDVLNFHKETKIIQKKDVAQVPDTIEYIVPNATLG